MLPFSSLHSLGSRPGVFCLIRAWESTLFGGCCAAFSGRFPCGCRKIKSLIRIIDVSESGKRDGSFPVNFSDNLH